MLFFSFFKSLIGQEVIVELKNDVQVRGVLTSVDQFLNLKLREARAVDETAHPHLLSIRTCFVRGSVVRYVVLPPDAVDTKLLHDASRIESREQKKGK
jgi:U6 snRNA-associated Sm-like protein LSm2